MQPSDIIAIVAIALIIGGALAYIIIAKKSGKKCIGCPESSSCGAKGRCKGCSGSCQSNKNKL